MSRFSYLRQVVTNLNIARENLAKAQANGSYLNNELASKEWIKAYTAYVNA